MTKGLLLSAVLVTGCAPASYEIEKPPNKPNTQLTGAPPGTPQTPPATTPGAQPPPETPPPETPPVTPAQPPVPNPQQPPVTNPPQPQQPQNPPQPQDQGQQQQNPKQPGLPPLPQLPQPVPPVQTSEPGIEPGSLTPGGIVQGNPPECNEVTTCSRTQLPKCNAANQGLYAHVMSVGIFVCDKGNWCPVAGETH